MSLTKLIRLPILANARLLAPRGATVSQSARMVHKGRFDDSFFGVASNLMRNLEREFDQMRNSLMRSAFNPSIPFINVPRLFQQPISSNEPVTHEDLIQIDSEGNRKFNVQYDLTGFEPEEVKIATEGNMLCISAKKEKKTDKSYFLREMSQSYALPEDLKIDDLKTKFQDGVLTIEAPLPKKVEAGKKPAEIPIEHKKIPSTS